MLKRRVDELRKELRGLGPEKKAKTYAQNYRRLQEIVQEMTLLNMRLLKLDGAD